MGQKVVRCVARYLDVSEELWTIVLHVDKAHDGKTSCGERLNVTALSISATASRFNDTFAALHRLKSWRRMEAGSCSFRKSAANFPHREKKYVPKV